MDPRRVTIGLAVCAASVFILRADLGPVKSEPNLEKRARLALAHADKQVDAAREAYQGGDWNKVLAALEQSSQAVDLAFESLKQTGKNPGSGSKHFKNAEIKTRELARKLDNFRQQAGVDEQAAVEKVRVHVQQVHDELLEGIMGRAKWRKK
jgi:hypothetical protein